MTSVQATHRPFRPLWLAVAAGGVVTALSLGVRSTFGLLITPIADGLGSDLGAISLAVAVQNLLWGLSQPVAGALSDRYGATWTLAGGGVLYALAMFLMSTADSAGMILLSGGFIAGIALGAASFAVVLSAVARMAPPEKRSMLLGIVSAVGSLGQFVLIPVARYLLDSRTWESTALILALALIPIVLLAPLLRSRVIATPEEVLATPAVPLRNDLRRASGSRAYILLNAAFFVCGFHVTFIGIHLAGFVDLRGLSGTTASTALALVGLFNVFGSLVVGALGQRYSFTKLLAGIYGLRAVTIAVFVSLPVTTTSTIIFAMAMGVLWLSTVPPTSAIVTQLFGPTNAGALFGIVFLSHQMGSFIGAWLGGELVDATGSYAFMWWLSVALGIFAMGAHLLIDERPVAEPPPGPGGLRIVPAGLAAITVAVGMSAALSLAAPTDERASSHTPMTYCVLGPTLHSQ